MAKMQYLTAPLRTDRLPPGIPYIIGNEAAERLSYYGMNTDTFVADVARRIAGRIQITTDSYRPYRSLVRKHLLERLDYATMQKLYATPFDLPEAIRRYSPQRCIGCKIRTLAGSPRPDRISTTFVERANLSVRHFNKRFARLGLGWSRKLDNHINALHLFIAAYNFCKVHSTLGCAPAVGLKLATETWTVERLIQEATKASKF